MTMKSFKQYIWFLIILLSYVCQACGPAQKSVPATVPTAEPVATLPLPVTAINTATPFIFPTATVLPTPTQVVVSVTAIKGNLFIRRGPDLAFNPIAVLNEGQSAMAMQRDVLANWLQIPIPDQPGKTGWVSIQSHFSTVSGDVMSLPEYTQTVWPVGASLRNCTHDQMEADPAGIIIPPVDKFPDNEVQLNPGSYFIRDIDVEHSPTVLKVQIAEGSAIDILTDGTGEHKKCPVP
jgi:hypothetical protein